MATTARQVLEKGDRVRVVPGHLWLSGRCGTIKEEEDRVGNRFIVKFDTDELGLWHDEDRDPVMRLGEADLILTEKAVRVAA